MATTTRKPLVSVTLPFSRETKRKVRFETDDESAAIEDVYIKKSVFNGTVPDNITITAS